MTQKINPAKKASLKNEIEWAKVIFSDGQTHELSSKPDSYCHFFEPIEINGQCVRFRLDWKDQDNYDHPTLDADFLDEVGCIKKSLTNEQKASHHTQATSSRQYTWNFQEESLEFNVTVQWNIHPNPVVLTLNGIADADVISPSDKQWRHTDGLWIYNMDSECTGKIDGFSDFSSEYKGWFKIKIGESGFLDVHINDIEYKSQDFPTLHEMLQSAYPELYV